MNQHLTEIYESCRPREALASQQSANSANVLLGSEVEQFAKLIVADCVKIAEIGLAPHVAAAIQERFGIVI